MGWIIGILVFFAFLWFLFAFPKQTLGCVTVLVIVSFLSDQAFIGQPEAKRKERESRVSVTVAYDSTVCSAGYPLLVTAVNKSDKTVEKIQFEIEIFRPGFSTDYAGYDNDYTLDKILAPGNGWKSCYRLPTSFTNPGTDAGELEYHIDSYKSISFREQ